MQQAVALIVIYNHRYDRNIEIVEKIYGGRFSHIFHLVPFYTGNRKNVIPVYESSYYFQGYVAQGFRHYQGDYEHYFFIADDMIINPLITENNYKSVFGLDSQSGFISELHSMPAVKWPYDREAVTFDPYKRGVEIKGEIPSPEVAAAVMKAHGVAAGPFLLKDTYFFNDDFSFKNVVRQTIRIAYDKFILKTNYKSSKYPLARSYSDIFIVSASSAPRFVQYCGAFAAADLFVEVAIPTALALSGEKITVQADLKLRGRPLWSQDDLKLLDTFQYKLKNLLENFPEEYIYLHPIKLSRWDVTL